MCPARSKYKVQKIELGDTVLRVNITITATLGLALIAVGSSCFSPDRDEGLTCSSEGLCPGSQVCDFDNVCRDNFSNDAANVVSGDASEDARTDGSTLIDASESPDASDSEVVFDLIPDGLPFVSTAIGLSFIGKPFDPIECAAGEVMYGVEARVFSTGICNLKARCGRLEVSGEALLATLEAINDTVPLGLGVGDCASGAPISTATCPVNTVVSGIRGVGTGNTIPLLTKLVLQCSPISNLGAVQESVAANDLGGLGSPVLVNETVSCGDDRVAVGIQGTADQILGSLKLICRNLEAIQQ